VSLPRGSDTPSLLYVGSDEEGVASLRARLDGAADAVRYETVGTATAAVRSLEREAWTWVVAEQSLPDGDGLSVLRQCRTRRPDAVTILCSTSSSEALVERTYEAGVDEFVAGTGPEKWVVVAHHARTRLDGREATDGRRTDHPLEALAATTSDAIVTVDASNAIRYANPAVADVFGYDPDELVGESLTTLLPPDLVEGRSGRVDPSPSAGDWQDVELPGRRKDGEVVPLSVVFSEHVDGEERLFTGVMRDVGERKRLAAERDLYHDATQRILRAPSFEAGLEVALAAVGDAMGWGYGEAWVATGDRLERAGDPYTTSAATAAFGEATADSRFERGEGLVGRVWETAAPEWLADLTDDPSPFDRGDGATAAGLRAALGVPIVSDGSVVAVLVFCLDERRTLDGTMLEATRTIAADLGRLMERLEAETALREERNLNARILETSPVGIAILDADGTVGYCNDRAAEILGVEESAVPFSYADLDVDLLAFDGRPLAADGDPYRRLAEADEPVAGELRLTVGAETRWLSLHSVPLANESEEPASAVVSLQDVTERKRRERRLQQHDAVMNTVGDGLYALDEAGRFVVVNDAYCELTGYDREQLLGRPAGEFVGETVTEEARDLQETVLRDGRSVATLETTLTTASGEAVPIEARTVSRCSSSGRSATGEPASSATSASAAVARNDSPASTRSASRSPSPRRPRRSPPSSSREPARYSTFP